jgi:Uma2 family endonuclease
MQRAQKASKPVGLTYDDLRRLPDDLMRHELIDGEHYVTPAPSPKHQRALGRAYLFIANYLEDHPLGSVYFAPFDVVFDPINCVEPDLLYVSREREARQMTEDNLAGAPDLVVEVLSPSTKRVDEGAKLALYDRFGVPEYWVFDPLGEKVRIYRRKDGQLQLVAELSRQQGNTVEKLTTPFFPGLEIPLDKVFE